MGGNDWSEAVDDLREKLVAVERQANNVAVQLPALFRVLGSLKVDIVKSKLEKEQRRVARVRGVTALKQDERKLGISLGLGFAGLVLGGALSKDSHSALGAGVGALDASLQKFGKSPWAVSLDREMLVVPTDQITAGRVWVTWESFGEAMENLRKKTLAGEQLGDLEAIVSELMQDHKIQRYPMISLDRPTDFWE